MRPDLELVLGHIILQKPPIHYSRENVVGPNSFAVETFYMFLDWAKPSRICKPKSRC
jgi:hypothetical protein